MADDIDIAAKIDASSAAEILARRIQNIEIGNTGEFNAVSPLGSAAEGCLPVIGSGGPFFI